MVFTFFSVPTKGMTRHHSLRGGMGKLCHLSQGSCCTKARLLSQKCSQASEIPQSRYNDHKYHLATHTEIYEWKTTQNTKRRQKYSISCRIKNSLIPLACQSRPILNKWSYYSQSMSYTIFCCICVYMCDSDNTKHTFTSIPLATNHRSLPYKSNHSENKNTLKSMKRKLSGFSCFQIFFLQHVLLS